MFKIIDVYLEEGPCVFEFEHLDNYVQSILDLKNNYGELGNQILDKIRHRIS